MNFEHHISADLPSPSGDEPTSLRRDIVDELSDHLACAAGSEGAADENCDEDEIRERVLDRFGDPGRIARRLWFDAIKGKLMMQKFATTFSAVAAVAAIAGCVILWVAVDSGRDAVAQALEEQRRDREQHAKANAALLAKLEALTKESEQPAKSMEWNPLKFKLLLGDQGNEPAVGFQVTIQGTPYGTKQSLTKKSNKSGIVDFGSVRPGGYMVNLSTPWHFSNSLYINVAPGEERIVTVRCPRERVENSRVQLKVDLPQDLLDRKVAVMIKRSGPRLSAGTHVWLLRSSWECFVGNGHTEAEAVHDWSRETVHSPFGRNILGVASHSETAKELFQNGQPARRQNAVPATPPEWKTADYHIRELVVLLSADSTTSLPSFLFTRYTRSGKTGWGIIGEARLYENNKYVGPVFRPQAGKDNVWTVKLPDKLLKRVRERLRNLDADSKQRSTREAKFEQLIKGKTTTGTDFDKMTDDERELYVKITRGYFSFLDSTGNRDRTLQESEWNSSRRIKPIFEKAKIDLATPMTEFEFVMHYIRLIGTNDLTWKNRGKEPMGDRRINRLRP